MMLHLPSKASAYALLAANLYLTGCGGDTTGLAIGEEKVDDNESAIEAEMISLIKDITIERSEKRGDEVIRRFNQPKTIACLQGSMTIDQLEPKLSIGLFSRPGSYPVTLRFSNATKFDDRKKDLRGLSIRVSNVDGATGIGGVQDFTFNSHPVLFAGTPEDFLSFVQASASDNVLWYFLNPLDPHLKSLWIIFKARGNPSSPLHIDYFSTTPFAYGDSAVKYSVRACDTPNTRVAADNENYLRQAIEDGLSSGEQCLNLMVQFQSDADLMPIEDASVEWPEDISPFRIVAKIWLTPQAFSTREALDKCEAMQFNPWNTLAAHRPLGGINRVRKNLYGELGKFRATQNTGTNQTPIGTTSHP